MNKFAVSALLALSAIAQEAAPTTCLLGKSDAVGVTELPASGTTSYSDLATIEGLEEAGFQLRLSDITICMQQAGRLGLIRSTLQKISVEGTSSPSTSMLSAIGASDGTATYNCETLSLDYTNGEYL